MAFSISKQVQNTLKQITLHYQVRGFKVISTFENGALKYPIKWTRSKLQINLVTCAADSHVPRAQNSIRFVKGRLRNIQSETLFTKYPRRLTIKMTKCTTVLINSLRRKSGVNFVMSPRQVLFGKKFKPPLCKMEELVMVYGVQANNKTLRPRAFYALYIGPNDGGSGHSVFKLLTKEMIITPKCKPVPMSDNVINVVNKLGEEEGILNGVHFRNMHK